MKANRVKNLPKKCPILNVSVPKFHRVSPKSQTIYAMNIIVHICNLLRNVILKCFQYDDQFRPNRDPDYLNGLYRIILCDLVT